MKKLFTVFLIAFLGFAYAQPTATLTGGGDICDDGTSTAPLTISLTGNGPWMVGIKAPIIGLQTIPVTSSPFTYDSKFPGCYSLVSITDRNNTQGTINGTSCIDFYPNVIATAEIKCALDNTLGGVTLASNEIQIVVTVNQGDLNSIHITETTPYNVLFSETTPGSGIWYSYPINENNRVDINITDANNCNNGQTLTNLSKQCNCLAQIDLFAFAESQICEENTTTLTVKYSGGTSDYKVILDLPVSTDIIKTGQTGITTFTVNEEGGYSVSVISNGDACGLTEKSISLTHHSIPEATIYGGTTICDDPNVTTNLSVELTQGTEPFDVDINIDNTPYKALTSLTNPHKEPVNKKGIYTLKIGSLIDHNGCIGTVSGFSQVNHHPDIQTRINLLCQKEDPTISSTDVYVIEVTVTSGDLTTIITNSTGSYTGASAGPITFTRIGTTNVFRSQEIHEDNTSSLVINDQYNCNGGQTITGLKQKCTCPGIATLSLSSPIELCADGSTVDLNIHLTGTGPWTFDVMNGTTPVETGVTISGPITGSYTHTITANSTADAGTYTLNNFTDANGGATCIGEVINSQTVIVSPLPKATLTGENGTICEDDNKPLKIDFNQGNNNYTVDLLKNGTFVETLTGINGTALTYNAKETGVYTLQNVTDNKSCVGTTTGSVNLTVTPNPTATITGGGTICVPTNENYDIIIDALDPTTAYNVIYSINGIAQLPLNTFPHTISTPAHGIYKIESITETGGTGCSSNNLPDMVSVITHQPPTAEITSKCSTDSPIGGYTLSDDEFQIVLNFTKGDLETITITETSTSGVNFIKIAQGSQKWFSEPIKQEEVIDLHVTDMYDCNGGTNIKSINKKCSVVSGLQSPNGANEAMIVYPNPTQSSFQLQLRDDVKNATLKIFDVLGNNVSEQILTQSTSEISVSDFETGLYIIEVTQGNKQYIERIMIK